MVAVVVVVDQVGLVLELHTVAAGDWTATTESAKHKPAAGFGSVGIVGVVALVQRAGRAEEAGDIVGRLSAGRGTRAGERVWWAAHCRNRNQRYTQDSHDDWT